MLKKHRIDRVLRRGEVSQEGSFVIGYQARLKKAERKLTLPDRP